MADVDAGNGMACRRAAVTALVVIVSCAFGVGAQATERTGKEVVDSLCVSCHGTGAGGAPKIGDREAWTPRVKQGLDVVVRSAIHGHGAMPPRGGMADLTDAEIRSAIVYMFNVGTTATVEVR